MKIIELLYQSIHPSLVNRSQNDGLSHFPHVYPKKEFLLRGENKQLILQTILLTLLAHFVFICQQTEKKYIRKKYIWSLKAKLHLKFYYFPEMQVKTIMRKAALQLLVLLSILVQSKE